jgi:flagellin
MPISIMTNVQSLNAQRNLNSTQTKLSGNLQKLSSGLRVNSAADDAAGLAISERFKAQIRSYSQAERNANDGVSLLQTAEGAMNEIAGSLIRMRELAMQSANGTLGTAERGFLNNEVADLTTEIDRIASVTQFNGLNVLDGSYSGQTLQVGIGATANDTIGITISNASFSSLAGATVDLTTQSAAQAALGTIDTAINALSTRRASIGTAQNRLQVTMSNLASARENVTAANGRIRDVDVANESAELTKNNILSQVGLSVLAQANQAPSVALSLLR